jgi:transcriptional regulator with XRE-family HTH domain
MVKATAPATLTREQFAARLGITRKTFRKLERNGAPDGKPLVPLAKGTGPKALAIFDAKRADEIRQFWHELESGRWFNPQTKEWEVSTERLLKDLHACCDDLMEKLPGRRNRWRKLTERTINEWHDRCIHRPGNKPLTYTLRRLRGGMGGPEAWHPEEQKKEIEQSLREIFQGRVGDKYTAYGIYRNGGPAPRTTYKLLAKGLINAGEGKNKIGSRGRPKKTFDAPETIKTVHQQHLAELRKGFDGFYDNGTRMDLRNFSKAIGKHYVSVTRLIRQSLTTKDPLCKLLELEKRQPPGWRNGHREWTVTVTGKDDFLRAANGLLDLPQPTMPSAQSKTKSGQKSPPLPLVGHGDTGIPERSRQLLIECFADGLELFYQRRDQRAGKPGARQKWPGLRERAKEMQERGLTLKQAYRALRDELGQDNVPEDFEKFKEHCRPPRKKMVGD